MQKNLRLSKEQAAELLQRRRAFLGQVGSLLHDRRRIQASMKVQGSLSLLPCLYIFLSITLVVHTWGTHQVYTRPTS